MKKTKVLVFWKFKGDKLELMRLPYDPTSTNAISKVYEADEDIKDCKLTFINGKEYIACVDEPKYIKILEVADSGAQKMYKVNIFKDYYVGTYFATTPDQNSLRSYGYCNGMLYSGDGITILQEKGKEKEGKFTAIYYSKFSLEYGSLKFPMVSEDFILYSLNPEYDSSYITQNQSLLLG